MTRLILVRHGHADDTDGRCVGHADVPLSDSGAAGIRALIEGCHEALRKTSRIISSDLARAAASARIIGDIAGVPVTYDARLREMSFGSWDGRSWDDVEKTDGVRLNTWMEGWITEAPPDGETLAELVARATEWLSELPRHTDETIIAVAHAGWIRAVRTAIERASFEKLFDIPVDHAHATIICLHVNPPLVIAANIEHLNSSYLGA